LEQLDLQVLKVELEQLVSRVKLDTQDLQDSVVSLALLVLPAHRDLKVSQDLVVELVALEEQELGV
jgi:hypothetical protein